MRMPNVCPQSQSQRQAHLTPSAYLLPGCAPNRWGQRIQHMHQAGNASMQDCIGAAALLCRLAPYHCYAHVLDNRSNASSQWGLPMLPKSII